jgi:hypothetical protein
MVWSNLHFYQFVQAGLTGLAYGSDRFLLQYQLQDQQLIKLGDTPRIAAESF